MIALARFAQQYQAGLLGRDDIRVHSQSIAEIAHMGRGAERQLGTQYVVHHVGARLYFYTFWGVDSHYFELRSAQHVVNNG